MKAYLDIVNKVLTDGVRKENRTGVDTFAVPGAMFEHDMSEGFPLLTTKRVPFRLIATENEFFIRGITDKNWLKARNNHIWDEWCNPMKVPYGHDEETRKAMAEENDLGPIYGYQWRNFGSVYPDLTGGVDQLRNLVETLHNNPNDRRMIVSAWNPTDLKAMALPPCHYGFQVTVINGKLNLMWNQRSVDVALGLPFNIAGYGLILHLLARDAGLEEGKLIGFLGDTHIYENHIEGLKKQIERELYSLPIIETSGPNDIFQWESGNSQMIGYEHHETIKFEVAI